MTLDEAIAEVRRVTPGADPWTGEDFTCEQEDHAPSRVDHAIAAILNAVASGDLIPLADHKLAVALVVQQAADVIWSTKDEDDWNYWGFGVDQAARRSDLIAAKSIILALADTDALAEVQTLKAERDSFRAVIEGACYGDINGIAKNTVEQSRALGEAVMHLTIERGKRAEAAEAEVARTDERAARICEALLRKGVSPEKWPDYFRNRAAGDQIVARAAGDDRRPCAGNHGA